MSPRKGRPRQDAKGDEALTKAEQKLARSKRDGEYDYPGPVVRQGRTGNA